MQRKNLIAKIHIGKTRLGLDEDTYRQLLVNTTGIASCALMNEGELQLVLNAMKQKGFNVRSAFWGNRAAPRDDKKIYLAKITALLAKHGLPKEYADGIAKRSFKVDVVHWLQPWQLRKVVQMLSVYDHQKQKS
ncbi:gp16 family protein [Rodentibacter pneumotropicus]|uniref:Regulatory protein GemA n=1 Tax=Rodentibacter pneumotropicus TaxID=758 RepID=A0A4S2Q3R4_9PAST|nr:regulatory protein GemA [Rodentibacter pneumotropicus]THA10477.1 regulatory protein GemA [Rodentibacter pneumotropicus]